MGAWRVSETIDRAHNLGRFGAGARLGTHLSVAKMLAGSPQGGPASSDICRDHSVEEDQKGNKSGSPNDVKRARDGIQLSFDVAADGIASVPIPKLSDPSRRPPAEQAARQDQARLMVITALSSRHF
jgi:hypothetical protein